MKRKMFFVVALLGLFTFLVGCVNESPADVDFMNTVITVDINPSIELMTDYEGLIKKVKPLNDDAASLLDDIELVGLTVDEALAVIVELASEVGYLDFDVDNVVLISVCQDGEKKQIKKKDQQRLEKQLKEKLQKEMHKQYRYGQVVIDKVEKSDELKDEAKELGMSAGKLAIIKDLIEENDELTLEELKDLSVKEILELLNIDNEEFQKEKQKSKKDFEDWLDKDQDRKEEHERKKNEKKNKDEKPQKGEGNKEDRPERNQDCESKGEGNKEDRPERNEDREPKGEGNKHNDETNQNGQNNKDN